MPVRNEEIARIFEQVADLLEIEEANPFRVRAYRAAAETARSLPRGLHDMVRRGEDLSELPAIGEDLAAKIAEICETGGLSLLDELGEHTPRGVLELLDVPGIGPKRAHVLHEELGIASRRELARAAREGRVRELPGFGARTERAILEALEERPAGAAKATDRTPWGEAEPVARALALHLRGGKGVGEVEVAGSFRRCRESVGDLDLLATSREGAAVVERLTSHREVARVLARGDTRATVLLRSGLQVDLRVVPRVSFGAALAYFTGSRAHTIAVRRLARERGLKINEYGVFEGQERVAGKTEESVYRAVGLDWIPPELREDRGELEAAREHALPDLIEPGDLRGDLHARGSGESGTAELAALVDAARERGLDWIAVTLPARATRAQLARLERLDGRHAGLRVLRGVEVEIARDGTLEADDDRLADADLVVGAALAHLDLTRAKQTERLLCAMDDPRLHVLAHPTGRLIGEREPCALDLERLLAGAAERGCALELNADPRRLDLPDVQLQAAARAGARIALASAARGPAGLENLRLGVGYARRGWLTAADVLNTRSWSATARLLRR